MEIFKGKSVAIPAILIFGIDIRF